MKNRNINLQEYLKKFRKENTYLPQDRLCLVFLPRDQKTDLFDLPGRIDAPYQFVLTYRTNTEKFIGIAAIGFSYNDEQKEICINQIQALPSDRSEETKEGYNVISNIRWEKMLVTILKDIGEQLGFKIIKILKSAHNEWRYENEEESEWQKEHNNRLKMRYDVTAKRMGFKSGPNEKYWSKEV